MEKDRVLPFMSVLALKKLRMNDGGRAMTVAVKAIYTVSINAFSAISKMLSSGVINAVKILEADCNPLAEKKSIGEISVIIQPAMIEQLNESHMRCLPNNGIALFVSERMNIPAD